MIVQINYTGYDGPNVNQASHTPSVWGYYSTEHNKESVIQGLTFSHYMS